MAEDYKEVIRRAVLDEESFLRATFSGQWGAQPLPWLKVTIRPVLIKERRHLQVSHFEARKDITKNYAGAEAAEKLDELLALPFKNINVQTTAGDLHVQFSRKGRPVIHRGKASRQVAAPDLAHDRHKELPLPEGRADPFLQSIGIMTPDGRIKANMADKFRQINEFLKLVGHTGELERFDGRPIHIADLGCGSALLTFATYHYLHDVLGMPARLVGVDVKEDLLARQTEQAEALQWGDVCFQACRIAEFQPEEPPDVILALHACDTATDEALAQGLRWRSRLIFSVPCCHHHLQAQLGRQPAPALFEPVFRHGILSERLGDILTDSFRALILRIMGYRTDVVEFISSEHTARNLMIRAVRSAAPGERQFVQEYLALKEFWRVTPYLETLLQSTTDFPRLLAESAAASL
ncbi:MAG TPA: SAM-dependent methyltransferase [Ardenticatenaceae bacterium]|nr:SAM-dependent methyltransferase [Ardenticatenaceae bacterium]